MESRSKVFAGAGTGRDDRSGDRYVGLSGMLEIQYTSHDFPDARVPSWGYLETSWDELLWAAISIGRPNRAYVFKHGNASYHEAVFRASLVRMALTKEPFNRSLHRTEAFRGLDPTEKGAITYFLGMTVCKVFASRLLNTPWLLHLDVFRDQLDPVALGGRSRPDLVGQDSGGAWHAFECKGRSSVPSSEDKRKAKTQARRLMSVNSTCCSLHIGAISYFKKDKLEFYWCDPDPEEPEKLEPISVRIPEEAWGIYYGPALSLASGSALERATDDRASIDLEVQIHPEVREYLMEGRWDAARSLAVETRTDLMDQGFHPDGLKVVAGESWRRPFKSGGFAE